MADSKKYDGSTWQHSLRKFTTAAEIVENPLYSDGTAITAYTLKGNTETSGNPSPSNPITISGVGNKTANLTSTNTWKNIYTTDSRSYFSASFQIVGGTQSIVNVRDTGDYTLKLTGLTNETVRFKHNGSTTDIIIFSYVCNFSEPTDLTISFYANGYNPTVLNGIDINNIMLNTGSTALPFEPWGYKIPISSAGQTTPVYLGEAETTRQVKKIVLTGQENWEYQSQYSRFVTELSNVAITGLRYTPFLCTHYQPISDGRAIENVPNNAAYLALTSTATGKLNIKTDAFASETAFSEYLATQYAAGTPVTVWVVMYNAQTAAINEPLMAITTNDSIVHADSISNAVAIPTTEGANTITVDTTVQPSEFTATWSGWHNAYVKEKSENLLDEAILRDHYNINNQGYPYQDAQGNSRIATIEPINVETLNNVTISYDINNANTVLFILSVFNGETLISRTANNTNGTVIDTSNATHIYLCFYVIYEDIVLSDVNYVMVNSGSQPLPYEPYWK